MSSREAVLYAFSRTPPPGEDALTSCNCEECRWDVARLRGKKWTRLSPDDFGASDGGANFALLTPSAFHYYLPGLLLLALDHPDLAPEFIAKIINRLTAPDSTAEARLPRIAQLIKRLTLRQREVLVEFLHQAAPSTPHVPPIWEAAIASLIGGSPSFYSATAVDQWLVEQHGRDSGLPGASQLD
jgi:hypothetical protein